MKKPNVGDKLYMVWIGDRRYKQSNREVTVTKVGRKYFYVDDDNTQFDLEDWKSTWEFGGSDWECYESKQAYDDHAELVKLNDKFRDRFSRYGKPNITLDQARRIMEIINENK